MLDSCSIDRVSIEIYENQFFKSDFTIIRELESGREGSRAAIVALRDECLGSDIVDCSSFIIRLDLVL